ncbi:MAG: UDP-N-acetylmuramoyl-tripeptide--D-alanyl-D-alanine ligase [Methylotenera sp.]|nr:UDP-N-acetylmuramoyl-tripeptide--D-alanyl-D-alanine ligase [Oligoflexia bacterium]
MNPVFVQNALKTVLVAQTAGATHRTTETLPYSSITTDSRKIQKCCLFVAIAGDKFDGHDFIGAAVAGGASAVICREDFAVPAGAPETVQFFRVADTVEAYRTLAGAWRREFTIPVILVAGSVGKTTTKELLSALLKGKFTEVLKTAGSQNGYVGIPMTLLELRPHHQVAVIEVGIDEIGAMVQHTKLVQADHSILTAIGPEHLEKLIDVPTVAREESLALTEVSERGGAVVLRLDDEWIAPLATKLKTPKKSGFTLSSSGLSQANAQTLVGELTHSASQMKFSGMGLEPAEIELPLLGVHNAVNLLGAIAMARAVGLTRQEILDGLKTFKGTDGRSELKKLKQGNPVVCDYYNANPTSVEAGLELLTQVAGPKTRWACLGDMLELGPNEETFHRDLSKKIRKLKIENVLLYGPRMKWLLSELQNQGFSGYLSHFSTHQELAQSLSSQITPQDAILIKGSRGMKMEEVWKALQLSPPAS